ncbi:MAG TPA: MFS transporter [Candidatus Dormibacteraeota bacterium]
MLWCSQTASFFGRMVSAVAVPFQIYALTRSTLAVGLLELFTFFPLLLLGLVGGAFADAHDRRRIALLSEIGFGLGAVLLLANSLLPHPQLVAIYVLELVDASFYALQRPALDSLLPRLVDRDELTAAAALNSLRSNFTQMAGPALGGVVIALASLPAAYALYVATFAFSLATLIPMRAVPPPTGAEPPSLRRIKAGLDYALSRPELLGTYLVDMAAMFFGMPVALFPAVAARLGGPAVLGILTAAPAAGSIVVSGASGWTRQVHRHGRAIILAAAAWGLAVIGFGFAPTLAVAVLFLALAGGADMVSGIFRTTIWNQTIPDHLRGRLAGIEMISYTSGPTLGNFEAGAVAAAWGVRVSVVSGGVLCVLCTIACAFLPGFWGYDANLQGRAAHSPA